MIFKNAIINDAVIFKMNDSELIPLTQDGEVIQLNSPTARCLQLLIERHGRVVSRDDFLKQVWGAKGIVVSQNTFYQNISLLRKSLKKAGLHEEIVVTVRRKGFTLSSDIVININEIRDDVEINELVHHYCSPTENPPCPAISEAHSMQTSTTAPGRLNLCNIPKWISFLVVFIFLIEIIAFFIFINN